MALVGRADDRDEDALDSYDRAAALVTDEEDAESDTRGMIDRERAASLKRLQRYDEAIAVLERLIATGRGDRPPAAAGPPAWRGRQHGWGRAGGRERRECWSGCWGGWS